MNKLWYDQPAADWESQALPVGNGRLGAMVFGGVTRDQLQFNEETLFTGRPSEVKKEAWKELESIRNLLRQKKYPEAQQAVETQFLRDFSYGDNSTFGCYQNFGSLGLQWHGGESVSAYRRELDLSRGVAKVSFTKEICHIVREVFCSAPDNVLVFRALSSQPEGLGVTISLEAGQPGASLGVDASGWLYLKGQVENLAYDCRVAVRAEGGQVLREEAALRIENATEITVLLTAATDYRAEDPALFNQRVLKSVEDYSFEQLKSRHEQDFSRLYDRTELNLDGEDWDHLATDQRLKLYRQGAVDNGLEVLLFQYARYLLISSSRPGTLPANLQGIWNQSNNPMWGSMFCYNINLNMNYWLAQPTGLSECHEPLLSFIDALRPSGRISAREYYNARGWCAAKKSDIWGFTQPYAKAVNGLFPGGGGWLCQDVWEYYTFTQNVDYLRNTGYSILKEAAEFYLDFLTVNDRGWLVSSPSTSPENTFLVSGQPCSVAEGTEMDHRIIQELFQNCLKASLLLGVDAEFRPLLEQALARLAPSQIGRYGQLQEWMEDFDDPADHHRHVSQLYGLHPGRMISPETTPELAQAARVTLESRGDGETGWSRAWKINLWARLQDGNRAHKLLRGLLQDCTHPNLFNVHPPFQIDGNFGVAAGMVEMLLQSDENCCVHLLPALPAAWPKGKAAGLRARGGLEVGFSWSEGKLQTATVKGLPGTEGTLRYAGIRVPFSLDQHGIFDYKPSRPRVRTVFLGDSITANGAFLKALDPTNFEFINRGQNSETASGLSEPDHPFPRPCILNRIDQVLEESQPDWCVICYGMNDGIYYPFSQQRFEAYQSGMRMLVAKVLACGAKAVVLTPPPFEAALFSQTKPEGQDRYSYLEPFEKYDAVLEQYRKWLLSVWPAPLVRVIDLAGELRKTGYATADGIHPLPQGYQEIARVLQKEVFGQPDR